MVDLSEGLGNLLKFRVKVDKPLPKKLARKLFVSFEGIDFSGKSLQANLLKERLEKAGFSVALFREPGGTAISEKVRQILLDPAHAEMLPMTELLLYSAARSQLVREKIRPALEAGKIVLCDRYADSSTAYQGFGRKLLLEDVQRAHSLAIEGLWPDVTFLLDIAPEEAIRRKTKARKLDRLEQEDLAFRKRVRNGYLGLARKEPDRFVILDGLANPARIHENIWVWIKNKLDI